MTRHVRGYIPRQGRMHGDQKGDQLGGGDGGVVELVDRGQRINGEPCGLIFTPMCGHDASREAASGQRVI